MTHTSYHNYTDTELLSLFESKRQHSEVISELCQRLEEFVTNEARKYRAECPVCSASLEVGFDDDKVTLDT